MEFLGLAAETDHIDDTRHLLELPFQNPILGDLEVHKAVTFAGELVAIDLAHGRRGRQLRLHAGRQFSHLEPV